MNCRAQHFMISWFLTIFFLSYYFLEFDEFIFSSQDTYNSWLKERYEDHPLTHSDLDLDLWLETGSSGGLYRNQVYGFSNTMIKNLQTAHSVATIGCSQLIPSTQTLKFAAILDQQVQAWTTHFNKKYE